MSNMAAALPDYQMRQYAQQPYAQQFPSPGGAAQPIMYQYPQGAQYAGQSANSYNHPYAQQYPAHFIQQGQPRPQQAPYPQYITNTMASGSPQSMANQGFVVQQQQMMHNPGPNMQTPQAGNAMYPGSYGTRIAGPYALPQLRLDSSLAQPHGTSAYHNPNLQGKSGGYLMLKNLG
jgi:hypothetical protein